jgi:hypothetical protein
MATYASSIRTDSMMPKCAFEQHAREEAHFSFFPDVCHKASSAYAATEFGEYPVFEAEGLIYRSRGQRPRSKSSGSFRAERAPHVCSLQFSIIPVKINPIVPRIRLAFVAREIGRPNFKPAVAHVAAAPCDTYPPGIH